MWLRTSSVTAFLSAAAAFVAAAAGGITEPTGIAAFIAIIASVFAYGIGPLVLTFSMRQAALSSWWAVAAALFAASLWTAIALLSRLDDAGDGCRRGSLLSAPSASASGWSSRA